MGATFAGSVRVVRFCWRVPSIARMFGAIYYRGAMTLQALREKIGDPTFVRIMRDWATQNRYGNVTTPQFVALAEGASGLDLKHFFDVWLYQPDKPTSW